uniref:Variant surface glycoprotein 1272 n=1 Tax=Trypanosoma brucei TaxID=5691 RepID=M4SY34_9TRYP|nr:variant surface glycoprotein 1272 [Trypanosoma brucei]
MLLILTTLVLILFSGARPNDELANLPDFRVICRIVQHAAAGFENPAATVVPDPEQLAALASKLAILNDNNETRFKDEKTRTAHGITGKEQRFNAKPGTGHLRAKLLQLENLTKQLAAEAASNKTEIEKATEDANNLLAEAVYGEGATFKDSKDPERAITNERKDKLFGTQPDQTKNCGTTGAGKSQNANVGITLANDIYCLCLIGATTTKICDVTTPAAAIGTQLSTPASSSRDRFAALIKTCGPKPRHTTTSDLTALIEKFHTRLGSHFTTDATNDEIKFVLGRAAAPATGCDATNKQSCVNYKAYLGADPPQELRWVQKLQLAIQKIKTTEAPRAKLNDALNRLAALTETAKLTYGEGLTSAVQEPVLKVTGESNGQSKAEHVEAEEECNKKEKESECTANPKCAWDEKSADPTKRYTLSKVSKKSTQTGEGISREIIYNWL